MKIADLLTVDRTASGVDASSKKRALEVLSDMLSRDDEELAPTRVFDALIGRERLGSTGLGHGVAIPHGRLEGNDRTRAAFLQLRDGVDFDSNDRQPVDLLFAMVVPEDSTEEHLKVLARLAEMFSDADFDRRLREAGSAEDLHRLIVDWEAAH